jgi:hypothetical protein
MWMTLLMCCRFHSIISNGVYFNPELLLVRLLCLMTFELAFYTGHFNPGTLLWPWGKQQIVPPSPWSCELSFSQCQAIDLGCTVTFFILQHFVVTYYRCIRKYRELSVNVKLYGSLVMPFFVLVFLWVKICNPFFFYAKALCSPHRAVYFCVKKLKAGRSTKVLRYISIWRNDIVCLSLVVSTYSMYLLFLNINSFVQLDGCCRS